MRGFDRLPITLKTSVVLMGLMLTTVDVQYTHAQCRANKSQGVFGSLLNPVEQCSCSLCSSIWAGYPDGGSNCDSACDACPECEPDCGCEPTCGTEEACCDSGCASGCECEKKPKSGGLFTKLRGMFGAKSSKQQCKSGCKSCGCSASKCQGGSCGTGALDYDESGVAPAAPLPIEVSPVIPGAKVVPVPAPVPHHHYDDSSLPTPQTDATNDPFRDDNVRVRRTAVPSKKHAQASYSEEVNSRRLETNKYRRVSFEQPLDPSDRWNAPVHVKTFNR